VCQSQRQVEKVEKRAEELLNETTTKTLLGDNEEYFTDLDKNTTNIVEAAITTEVSKDATTTNQSSEGETIYDNKGMPADEEIEPDAEIERSQSKMGLNATIISNQEPPLNKPTLSTNLEEVNFDHLENNEMHFDRRMLKLIEGKLQATRSATSFSKYFFPNRL